MRWLRYGTWPSNHDLDLILEADERTYEAVEQLVGPLVLEPGRIDYGARQVRVDDLPIPPDLIRQAADAAGGLPLDAKLSPYPRGFSVGAWIDPPYTTAHLAWGSTLSKAFFAGAVPLDSAEAVSS